ncbi:MAG: glycine-rich domain-containing protein-like [Streptosporangiaceae bacterium]|nr:glycine-rich domain-containing protein-like [Streptosporangiaceae bacterium]MBV9856388.1 glycine-rich domain-containing protein-like [Streptosporangiaceae bacterium]
MTVTTDMAPAQVHAGEQIDALDLEPITYKLMHPEPGETAMTLAEADQRVAAYRRFLKLCVWYPEQSIVPSKAIDEVWHTHILDTAKYAADSEAVFGSFMHHFPYFGLRGTDDEATWQAAYARTRELFRLHFGTELPAGRAARGCHVGGSTCKDGNSICNFEAECEKSARSTLSQARPRPDRAAPVCT